MANIFGEGFPDQIKNQIDYRQKRYGSGNIGNRTADDISYLNSNTSWCKLVSGVDIDNLVFGQNIPIHPFSTVSIVISYFFSITYFSLRFTI